MEFVDTHCHVHFKRFGMSNQAACDNAVKAGVSRMICVGTTLSDSRQAIEFTAGHEGAWSSAGVHPHEAEEFLKAPGSRNELAELLKRPNAPNEQFLVGEGDDQVPGPRVDRDRGEVGEVPVGARRPR